MTTGCHRMQIALAQEDVVDALKFHGAAILGFEQNRIPHLNTANVGPGRYNFRPVQSASHLRCCWNDDAAAGTTLTVFPTFANKHAVVQQFDGY